MDAFLASTLAVGIAEIGDKTQLLTLLLVARFRARWSILAAILVATLINHGLSAWFGQWLSGFIPNHLDPYIIGGIFVVLGFWLLIPDGEDEVDPSLFKYGPFVASLILFFLAEMADKTQVATVVLAAKYDAFMPVLLGTTLGMVLANAPLVFAGSWLLQRVPVRVIHYLAAFLFIGMGLATILWR